jgi:hypothetical protein
MSEIEFENDNKEVLEKCCLVMEYHKDTQQESKDAKHTTRVAIQNILDQKKLRKSFELDYE